jgi:hypothetical protein
MAETPATTELDVLMARTRRLLTQTLADTARPTATAAANYLTRKLGALAVGVTLVVASAGLLVTGLVMLVSLVMPLWVACLGVGTISLLAGLLLLSRARA